jgi:histidyl-tRNA synthetase
MMPIEWARRGGGTRFYQFGAELIGNPGPESDGEVIALAASIMRRVGLKEFNIRIGHIGILRELLARAGVEGAQAAPILQKLDKKEYDEARLRMAEAGISSQEMDRIVEVTQTSGAVEVLDKVEGAPREHLLALRTSPTMDSPIPGGTWRRAADTDYYTGMVFEMTPPCWGPRSRSGWRILYPGRTVRGGESVLPRG